MILHVRSMLQPSLYMYCLKVKCCNLALLSECSILQPESLMLQPATYSGMLNVATWLHCLNVKCCNLALMTECSILQPESLMLQPATV